MIHVFLLSAVTLDDFGYCQVRDMQVCNFGISCCRQHKDNAKIREERRLLGLLKLVWSLEM